MNNITGSDLADFLEGDALANVIRGGKGDDEIVGGAGGDTLFGGDGSDSLWAEVYRNKDGNRGETANATMDELFGHAGDDVLYGGDGPELLNGGDGNDVIVGNGGDDQIDGGSGIDRAVYAYSSGSVTVDLATGISSGADGADSLTSIEDVTGSRFNDWLIGSAEDNQLDGGRNHDRLEGLDGNDSLRGGMGKDRLAGGRGDDDLDGGFGEDTATWASALRAVVVDLSAGTATGEGNDVLRNIENVIGSAFDDLITGDGSRNDLRGGDGDDEIYGLGGNDQIRGELGDDLIHGGAGVDQALFDEATNGVVVDLLARTATGEGADTLRSIEEVVGSSFADELYGTGSKNMLDGGRGADILKGRGGGDLLMGGRGLDTLYVRSGDEAYGGLGGDLLVVQGELSGADTQIIGGIGKDSLAASANASIASDVVLKVEWLLLDAFDFTISSKPLKSIDVISSDGEATLGRLTISDAVRPVSTLVRDLETLIVTGSSDSDDLTFTNTLGTPTNIEIFAGTGDDYLKTRRGDDTLHGGEGDDVFVSSRGNDEFYGDDGFDTVTFETMTVGVYASILRGVTDYVVFGNRERDVLSGIEKLIGTDFDDNIEGGRRNDVLLGGAGDDIIRGGNGSDVVAGGLGDDWLSGGLKADVFVLADDGGVDTIVDFNNGEDLIALAEGLTFGDLSFAQVGQDVEISTGGGLIAIVELAQRSDFTAIDFMDADLLTVL